jgi:hypothetical protein
MWPMSQNYFMAKYLKKKKKREEGGDTFLGEGYYNTYLIFTPLTEQTLSHETVQTRCLSTEKKLNVFKSMYL